MDKCTGIFECTCNLNKKKHCKIIRKKGAILKVSPKYLKHARLEWEFRSQLDTSLKNIFEGISIHIL